MLGPLTQILVFGARSGVWTTWEALRCGHIARPHQGCLNPVPQSRSGKRELGNMRVAAWQTQGKEVGIRPYAEHLPRPSPSLFPVLFSSSFFLSCLPLLFAPRPPPPLLSFSVLRPCRVWVGCFVCFLFLFFLGGRGGRFCVRFCDGCPTCSSNARLPRPARNSPCSACTARLLSFLSAL